MKPNPDPWRAPVAVMQIPDTGSHRDIEAGPAERKAMAEVAGLREILSASASLDVTPQGGGRFHPSSFRRLARASQAGLRAFAAMIIIPVRSRSK